MAEEEAPSSPRGGVEEAQGTPHTHASSSRTKIKRKHARKRVSNALKKGHTESRKAQTNSCSSTHQVTSTYRISLRMLLEGEAGSLQGFLAIWLTLCPRPPTTA